MSLAAALVLAALAGRQDGALLRMAPGAPPVVLCTWSEGPGHLAELRWPDGTAVEFRAVGPSFVADVPDALAGDPTAETMEVLWGTARAVVPAGRLFLSRAADGRWVLADEVTEPTGVPPAPLGIRVPSVVAPGSPEEEEAPADELLPPDEMRAARELLHGERDLSDPDSEPLTGGAKRALESPETRNTALAALLEPGHGLRFLRDVDWRLKTFDVEGETSLGMAFRYESRRDLDIRELDGGVRGLGYDLSIEGNIAFESDLNPVDFLAARLALDWFTSRGGSKGPLTAQQQQRAVDLATRSAQFTERDPWLRSPEWAELKQLARSVFSTQVYWELGLDGAFESDQDFDAKNYVIGAHAVLEVKAWDDEGELATLNLFDYPAALVRYLSGYDTELTPRGSALPTLVVHLDHVDPEGDTPRAVAGDGSSYERVRVEAIYKAPLALLEAEEYALTANYRSYHELSPSSAIRAADLDHYDWFVLAIESDTGLFASFSRGRQPFDDEDASVYALGWRFHF
jgi:hypothetical protein